MPTVALPFREAGYHTVYVGKWHLGGSNQMVRIPEGERGGFDHWLGYENRNAQWDTDVHGSGAEEGFRLEGYETDALTDLFVKYVEGHLGSGARKERQPFIGVLSVQPRTIPAWPRIVFTGAGIRPTSACAPTFRTCPGFANDSPTIFTA